MPATLSRVRAAFLLLALAACTHQDRLESLELITGGARADEQLPVIVALHGRGDRPELFARVFDGYRGRARVLIPRAPLPDGNGGFQWFAARTRDGDVDQISGEIRDASERVDRLAIELGVPVVVTGFSQGAMLSYALAAAHPEHIRAAVPVSGWLPPPLWPKSKPERAPIIRALHGTADPVVPFILDQRTCARLSELGYDVELGALEGVEHIVPREMHQRWLDLLSKLSAP